MVVDAFLSERPDTTESETTHALDQWWAEDEAGDEDSPLPDGELGSSDGAVVRRALLLLASNYSPSRLLAAVLYASMHPDAPVEEPVVEAPDDWLVGGGW